LERVQTLPQEQKQVGVNFGIENGVMLNHIELVGIVIFAEGADTLRSARRFPVLVGIRCSGCCCPAAQKIHFVKVVTNHV